ncbi:MAG: NADH-quinone oxidoreductase subunit A [Candidatus Puniceispirillum sp.]|nr:NADH-quinone oxidoreductase subunit A [Candidatus Puniceispirillum sp.]MCA0369847.1 NADH-quinone oxidoreductase subunit A [Pseudomonadota bacterium]
MGLLQEYVPILIFLFIAVGFSALLIFLGWLRGPKRPDAEKLSPYECGFEPFEAPRSRFNVRYYLVAILFIIFDLEVAFLFPWSISLSEVGLFGFWSMIIFLGILTAGFAYEWKKGALDWE